MTKTEAKRLKLTKTLEEAHALADRVLSMARRAKPSRPVVPGATREERRDSRNAKAAEIRAAVMERADGRCEWCGRDGFALEWAHVIDGNGNRRAHEAVETTAAICADCHHRGWHRNSAQTFRAAREWAIRHGFREALAAIERREAKAEMVRRTA